MLVQVFCKTPRVGKVKTRLAPALGAAGAVTLYKDMVTNALSQVLPEFADVQLWCFPACDDPFFGQFDCPRRLQQGRDLGERMQFALREGLESSNKVVLIGADVPPLDAAYLRSAFDVLDEHRVVLGPAEDGGYGLLGVRGAVPAIFSDIDWGTDKVLARTRRRLHCLGVSHALLPLLWDVDGPEDLPRYWRWRHQARRSR